jgi:YggT family protein
MLAPIFNLIDIVLGLYVLIIVIRVLLNLLQAFGVVSRRQNPLVGNVEDFCISLTEPALRMIPRGLRYFGNVDFAPLILLLVIQVLVRPYVAMFGAMLS